ncbi:MAG: aminotransferase class III-fold pyridoxal phosphate-dependent enzyme [Phycisphaerales bacterium]|nr:aminotransferase class III-fold pyridoxal phosphate-dependent enzyme [Phycisphaerales bacterium]
MNPQRVLDELARHQLVDGYPLVVDLERSEGSWIIDAASGEKYLDAFTCFASMPLGYNHPGMMDADYLQTLKLASLCNVSNADLYSVEMAQFVDAFATHATPEDFNHHFWIAGGGLAVENAMKAAFDWKARLLGRNDFADNVNDLAIVHFKEAFHGRTGYTMSVTNTLPDKVGLFPKFDWPRISNPTVEFDLDGNICNDIEALENQAYAELDAVFAAGSPTHDRVAGILIEPMQGEGGDNHFRPEFLARLRDYADTNQCLLLYDEVQSGFFGSGKPWMWQHHGVAPDIAAFGKKSQVCGIYAGPRMDEVEHNVFRRSSRINSTWGGNLVDMVRSRRYIEIIVADGLCDHVLNLGEHVIAGMREIARSTGAFSNVRGVGSLIACSFDTAEARDSLVRDLFNHKVIALPCGSRSMRFRLPLIMQQEEADILLNAVESAVSRAVSA